MIEIFENLIKDFNIQRKCGFDWSFFATGRKDYTNLINTRSDCVIFILENWSDSVSINQFNGEQSKSVTIDLFIGFSSELSENFYNESGECCNGKYMKSIKPLKLCLNGVFENFTFCLDDNFFKPIQITKNIKINYLDQNLDGYKLRLIYTT